MGAGGSVAKGKSPDCLRVLFTAVHSGVQLFVRVCIDSLLQGYETRHLHPYVCRAAYYLRTRATFAHLLLGPRQTRSGSTVVGLAVGVFTGGSYWFYGRTRGLGITPENVHHLRLQPGQAWRGPFRLRTPGTSPVREIVDSSSEPESEPEQ